MTGEMFRTRTGELTLAVSWSRVPRQVAPPAAGEVARAEDVETRYRQRYVDLVVNPDARDVFQPRARIIEAIRELPRRAGVRGGRDADDAAHSRRRHRAAVRHPSQRPRHGPLPAHCTGALSEATRRGRASTACTRSTGTSATRGCRRSTIPSSPCWSSTRPTRTTRPHGPHRGHAAAARAGPARHRRPSVGRARGVARPAVAPPDVLRRARRGPRDPGHARHRVTRPRRRDGGARAHGRRRRPGDAVEGRLRHPRGAHPGAADLRHGLPRGAVAALQRKREDGRLVDRFELYIGWP